MARLGLLLASLIVSSAFAAASTAAGDPFADLRRPLQLPALEAGAACPVSARHTVSPGFGPALGPGPVYPIGFDESSRVTFEFPPSAGQYAGSGFGGAKTLWVARPDYDGRILIRGARLDGPNEVRFSLGGSRTLLSELAFAAGQTIARSPGTEGWRQFPSATRLRGGGCYGFQIDGESFTRTVVFAATTVSGHETARTRRDCVPAEVRQLVREFVARFNAGRSARPDRLFATPPDFKWYSVGAPGARLGASAYDRTTLLRYLSTRRALGERLRLVSMRPGGNANGFFHFRFQLQRTIPHRTPKVYQGKGAAMCTAATGVQLAVWSAGGPISG